MSLLKGIEELEGLFDMVVENSQSRLVHKSQEVDALHDDLSWWKEEAQRTKKGVKERLEQERTAFNKAVAEKVEEVRQSLEDEIERAREERDAVSGEKDRWRSELERFVHSSKRKESEVKSRFRHLMSEMKEMKGRLQNKDEMFKRKIGQAEERAQAAEAEVLKFKDEVYKQKINFQQRSKVMSQKVMKLTTDVNKGKQRLQDVKAAFEVELQRRGRLVDELRRQRGDRNFVLLETQSVNVPSVDFPPVFATNKTNEKKEEAAEEPSTTSPGRKLSPREREMYSNVLQTLEMQSLEYSRLLQEKSQQVEELLSLLSKFEEESKEEQLSFVRALDKLNTEQNELESQVQEQLDEATQGRDIDEMITVPRVQTANTYQPRPLVPVNDRGKQFLYDTPPTSGGRVYGRSGSESMRPKIGGDKRDSPIGTSVMNSGRDNDESIEKLVKRVSVLEQLLGEQRIETNAALREVGKWKDISMLTLPLMDLLQTRSTGAGGNPANNLSQLSLSFLAQPPNMSQMLQTPSAADGARMPITPIQPNTSGVSVGPSQNQRFGSPQVAPTESSVGSDHSMRRKDLDIGESNDEPPSPINRLLTTNIQENVYGSHGASHMDGYGKRASFNQPYALHTNRQGSILFISELGNKCIRKISIADGLVVTVTSLSHISTKNRILNPTGICLDMEEGHLFVCDSKRNAILKVDVNSGAIFLVAGIQPVRGRRVVCHDVIAANRTTVYVSHTRGLISIHTRSRVQSDVCGGLRPGFRDGSFHDAMFYNPDGMRFIAPGELLVADSENHRIRHLDMQSKTVTTFAGSGEPGTVDGMCNTCRFNYPRKLSVDQSRGLVFVSERSDHIRVIDLSSRNVVSMTNVGFNCPAGIQWISLKESLVVSDMDNHSVRFIHFPSE